MKTGFITGFYYGNYVNRTKTEKIQIGTQQEDQGYYETEEYVDYRFCENVYLFGFPDPGREFRTEKLSLFDKNAFSRESLNNSNKKHVCQTCQKLSLKCQVTDIEKV